MNKSHLLILAIVLTCFLFGTDLRADERLRIKLKPPPPGQLNIDGMWSFTLINLTNQQQEVYLKGSATEEQDGLIATGQTVNINLKPNETKNMKVSDLPQTPDVNYVAKDPRYKESLIRQGKFPDGTYEICVSVISSNTNEELGTDCFTQTVESLGSITLLTPKDGDEIDTKAPIIFSWLFAGKPSGTYTLKIVEVQKGQSPETAMQKNRPFYTKEGIKSSPFNYPPTGNKFEEGKTYVWMVTSGSISSGLQVFSTPDFWFVGTDLTNVICQDINTGLYTWELNVINDVGTGASVILDPTNISINNISPSVTTSSFNIDPYNTTIPVGSSVTITGSFIITPSSTALTYLMLKLDIQKTINSNTVVHDYYPDNDEIVNCLIIPPTTTDCGPIRVDLGIDQEICVGETINLNPRLNVCCIDQQHNSPDQTFTTLNGVNYEIEMLGNYTFTNSGNVLDGQYFSGGPDLIPPNPGTIIWNGNTPTVGFPAGYNTGHIYNYEFIGNSQAITFHTPTQNQLDAFVGPTQQGLVYNAGTVRYCIWETANNTNSQCNFQYNAGSGNAFLIAAGRNATFTPTTPGTYTIMVNVDCDGRTTWDQVTITVNDCPPPPTTDCGPIQVDLGGNRDMCVGETINLNPRLNVCCIDQQHNSPDQTFTTLNGVNYELEITGNYTFTNTAPTNVLDGNYFNNPLTEIPETINWDLINPIGFPSAYNSGHEYNYGFIGNGQSITFHTPTQSQLNNHFINNPSLQGLIYNTGHVRYCIWETANNTNSQCNFQYNAGSGNAFLIAAGRNATFTPTTPGTYTIMVNVDCDGRTTWDQITVVVDDCVPCNCEDIENNLVTNGDFSNASQINLTNSSYSVPIWRNLSQPIGVNTYSIRNSGNWNNSWWVADDHTPGGNTNFLICDGYADGTETSIWRQEVTVINNTNYQFCVWGKNLIELRNPPFNYNDITPIIQFSINGNLIGQSLTLPQTNATNWSLLSEIWNSGSLSGTIIIEIVLVSTASTGMGNDVVIDDIIFKACNN